MGVGTLIIAELPRQWDHPERYCCEPAPAVLVSRAQTSPTEALGTTAVGAAVPCTARSICQSHIGRPQLRWMLLDSRLTSSDCFRPTSAPWDGEHPAPEAPPNSQDFWCFPLLQLGFVQIWKDVADSCELAAGKAVFWRFSEKNHMAKGLQMLKLGSSPWSSRRFV